MANIAHSEPSSSALVINAESIPLAGPQISLVAIFSAKFLSSEVTLACVESMRKPASMAADNETDS